MDIQCKPHRNEKKNNNKVIAGMKKKCGERKIYEN